jgi:hypothetical protein
VGAYLVFVDYVGSTETAKEIKAMGGENQVFSDIGDVPMFQLS